MYLGAGLVAIAIPVASIVICIRSAGSRGKDSFGSMIRGGGGMGGRGGGGGFGGYGGGGGGGGGVSMSVSRIRQLEEEVRIKT